MNLKTDFYQRVSDKAVICPMEMRHKVAAHFAEVAGWASGNPTETGTSNYTKLTNVIAEEATPWQILGYTLIAFIGKDVTYEDYLGEIPFVASPGRAPFLSAT